MKLFVMFVLAAALLVGSHVFARTELAEWRQIIEQRCSQCHTPQRIEQAILKGENFDEIIAKMIRLGAKLDSREQDVLGVFWSARQTSTEPLIAEGKTVSGDPLGEYRAVLESRCTGCHTLEPVEAAMLEGRSPWRNCLN